MKKYFYLATLFIAFFACSKPVEDHGIPTIPNGPIIPPLTPPVDVAGRMAIFGKSQYFVLYLSGKNVTVNWGSTGSRTYAKLDSTVAVQQYYSSVIHDTVIITGTNITYLKCSGNDLLNLDVSGNPALTRLDCSANSLDTLNLQNNTALKFLNCRGNNFSQPALDNLFTSLHSKAQLKDSVLFINNPGAFNTPGSIATAKGWSIDKIGNSKPTSLTFAANLSTARIGLTGSNIIIDWGDGSYDSYFNLSYTAPIVHNYTQAVKHWVKASGDAITHLNSSYSGITDLNVTAATGLTWLDCSMSNLYTLDVTKNTALTYLNCSNAQLSALDISNNTLLTYLDCSTSGLVSLDVSKNAALTELHCNYNYKLTALDLSGNPALEKLICVGTSFSALDVSASPKLSQLACNSAKITSLNVSNNPAIKQLNCGNNKLTALNLTNCKLLEMLDCNKNSIATLDVSGCPRLILLSVDNNKLTALDLSNNTSINGIWCGQNDLSATALNNMFTSLRMLTPDIPGTISQDLNPGSGNCDKTIAASKGWRVN